MASTSAVAGYNIYRGTQTAGPYTKLDSSYTVGTTYTDTTVQSAQNYFYVATAVDSTGMESSYSNEIPVAVP